MFIEKHAGPLQLKLLLKIDKYHLFGKMDGLFASFTDRWMDVWMEGWKDVWKNGSLIEKLKENGWLKSRI